MSYTYSSRLHELWPTSSNVADSVNIQTTPQHPLIDSWWLIKDLPPILSPFIILPDLSPYIICYQLPNMQFRVRIVGPRTKAIRVDRTNRSKTWVFRLKPYTLPSLIPLSELLNHSTNLDEMIPFSKETLFNQDIHQLLKCLTSYIPVQQEYQPFVQAFKRSYSTKFTPITVKGIADELGISQRYLQKLCTKYYGMPPKMILKIQRLSRSFHLREGYNNHNWAQIALEAGYYDQSHMIDEYQQFLKKSPGSLFNK